MTSDAHTRLASYGTLAPGRENHGELSDVPGRWLAGQVRGTVIDGSWRGMRGYPALILADDGGAVDVDVFESAALPEHWLRLDAFEGPGYQRVTVAVTTAEGVLAAQIYVQADVMEDRRSC